MEHVAELRRRLFYVLASVIAWTTAAYFVMHPIIDVLLEPSNGQKFIYTSPIGGMNFLLKVCLYVGIMFSLPVIVYNFLRYIEPLMQRNSARFIFWGSAASGLLAIAGLLFGYFLGLPAALHFLLNQFITSQVSPLLTIEAYLSFVTMYMLGAALMFQIPLIVLFINRIKPLTPQQLFRSERWVILGTVILAFIMNPTPSLYDQLFLAVPMILSYQLAIAIVWFVNRAATRRAAPAETEDVSQAGAAEDVPVRTTPSARYRPDVARVRAKPPVVVTAKATPARTRPYPLHSRLIQ